jgi:hypothetical protein
VKLITPAIVLFCIVVIFISKTAEDSLNAARRTVAIKPWRQAAELNYSKVISYDDPKELALFKIRPEDCQACHGIRWDQVPVPDADGKCSRFWLPSELVREAIVNH